MVIMFHVLKNHMIANLNADESGSPKNCTIGGAERGRQSSQNAKATFWTSTFFKELLRDNVLKDSVLYDQLAVRTRKLSLCVAYDEQFKQTVPEDLQTGFVNVFEYLYDPKQILVYTPDEIREMVKRIMAIYEEYDADEVRALITECDSLLQEKANAENQKAERVIETKLKKVLKDSMFERFADAIKVENMVNLEYEHATVDEILTGRFLASDSTFRDDGCLSVAHSVTTHKCEIESDFFSAMDCYTKSAAHLDYSDYMSGCFYTAWKLECDVFEKRVEKLGLDPERLLKAVVNAIIQYICLDSSKTQQRGKLSMPVASAILVEKYRVNHGCTHANAFDNPVESNGHGFIEQSVRQFIAGVKRDIKMSDVLPVDRYFLNEFDYPLDVKGCVNCTSLSDLIEKVTE